MTKRPLISVVTVVRNREEVIERCIQSVLGQSFTNFEYLIKDGNSTDKTVEIISKYAKHVTYFESSPDKSLYDAMNIATQHATGEWLCYIQSDDQFYDSHVLEHVSKYLESTSSDVVYGEALADFEWGVVKTLKAKPVKTIWKQMPFCHQAMFQRVSVAKANPFDLTYRSAADYEQIYRLYSQGYTFEAVPLMIARQAAGGISDTKRIAGLIEVGKIKKRYDSNRWHHFLHTIHIVKSAIRLRIRNILPKSIVAHIFKLRERLTEK